MTCCVLSIAHLQRALYVACYSADSQTGIFAVVLRAGVLRICPGLAGSVCSCEGKDAAYSVRKHPCTQANAALPRGMFTMQSICMIAHL